METNAYYAVSSKSTFQAHTRVAGCLLMQDWPRIHVLFHWWRSWMGSSVMLLDSNVARLTRVSVSLQNFVIYVYMVIDCNINELQLLISYWLASALICVTAFRWKRNKAIPSSVTMIADSFLWAFMIIGLAENCPPPGHQLMQGMHHVTLCMQSFLSMRAHLAFTALLMMPLLCCRCSSSQIWQGAVITLLLSENLHHGSCKESTTNNCHKVCWVRPLISFLYRGVLVDEKMRTQSRKMSHHHLSQSHGQQGIVTTSIVLYLSQANINWPQASPCPNFTGAPSVDLAT